jgi:SAM-dependent methyltransferase
VDARDANAEMIEYWNQGAGPVWVTHQARLDDQLAPLGARARLRAGLRPGERVLDVGCGCGASTLELARAVGPEGRVTAVDVSAPMLARARELAERAGLVETIEWIQGDAQSCELGEGAFDCVHSRFGVMFFDDPPAAFANLRQALAPGGRLVFLCWQARERNPWMLAPALAAARHLPLPPPPPPEAPGPFSLADSTRLRELLGRGGFRDAELEAIDEPLTLGGGSVDEALELFLAVGPVGAMLREARPEPELREQVVAAVRAAIESFQGPGGLRAPASAWLVTARR